MVQVKVLRFEGYKQGEFFIYECLELGLSAFGHTPDEAKSRMENALEVYFETVRELIGQGRHVVFPTPVRFYGFRRLRFDLRRWLGKKPTSPDSKGKFWDEYLKDVPRLNYAS